MSILTGNQMERPASVLKGISGDDAKDPALAIRGMPPNFGEHSLPHIVTFQGIISSIARIYRPSDEAIKDSFENARFMRNDCGLMECIEQRQRSTALLNWHLEPDDENDKTQQWLCEQLTAILEATPRFMQYRENLLHAIWFGRYGVSHRLRWKPVRGKMRLAIDRWRPVHGDKLAFRYDDGNQTFDEDQVGIRVGAGFTAGSMVAKRWTVEKINKVEPSDYGLVYFLEPYERSLLAIHKHMIEDGEYEDPQAAGKIHGVGIRSRIYWTWYQAQETLAWMMEYLERSAFGIEIWYYPWGNDEAKKHTRAAAEERIGQGRNIILVPRPLGEDTMAYGVERIEPSMAGLEACQKLVTEFFGWRMKRYILGQTLTSEAASTGLGSNLADIHLASFLQIVKYDATNLEETITTETVEPLKKFNWPRYRDIPIRFRIDTESADTEEKLKAYETAYRMGAKLKAQDVYDIIGASQPDPGDEVLQDPQHAQAQAQQAQMQAQTAAQQQAARGRSQVSMANRASQVKQVDHALQVNKIMEALGLKDRPGADEPGAEAGEEEGEPETYDRLPGGLGDNANPNQFDRQQVQKGVRTEMEHTADPGIATEIALDHLAENPQYYGQPEPDSESSERRRVVEAYSAEKPREQFSRQDEERIARHVKSGVGELLIPDNRGGVYGYCRDARGGISVEYYKARKPAAGQKSLWDEGDHPRDDSGEFVEKEGGGGGGDGESKVDKPEPDDAKDLPASLKKSEKGIDSESENARLDSSGDDKSISQTEGKKMSEFQAFLDKAKDEPSPKWQKAAETLAAMGDDERAQVEAYLAPNPKNRRRKLVDRIAEGASPLIPMTEEEVKAAEETKRKAEDEAAEKKATASREREEKRKAEMAAKPLEGKDKGEVGWKIEDRAGRLYVTGTRYGDPNLSKLKSIGAHWDASEKAWWIGKAKRSDLETLVEKVNGKKQSFADEAGRRKSAGLAAAIPYDAADVRAWAKSEGAVWDGINKQWLFPDQETLTVARGKIDDWHRERNDARRKDEMAQWKKEGEAKEKKAAAHKAKGERMFSKATESRHSPYSVGTRIRDKDGKIWVVTATEKSERFEDGLSSGFRIDDGYDHTAWARPATEEETAGTNKAERVAWLEKQLRILSLSPDDDRDRPRLDKERSDVLAELRALKGEEA